MTTVKNIKPVLVTLLLVIFINQIHAQIYIYNKNSLEKFKDGNTHVIVNDLNFPGSSEYLAVFKQFWTITKGIDFVKASDLQDNLKAGDSYFGLETVSVSGSMGGADVYTMLRLWLPTEKALAKKRKFTTDDENHIAQIYLSTDKKTYDITDFDGDGHIFNWNPGILKSYLKQLSTLLLSGKTIDLTDKVTNNEQLALLKNQTLFCPDDNFHKMNAFNAADGKETIHPDEIFQDYKFSYKILSNKELEDKLLADSEPFYYLLFLRNSSAKMVGIVNSRTGEIIYCRYHKLLAFALNPGDLKEIYKEIK